MKNRVLMVSITLILLGMITFAGCINVYNPAPGTGESSPTGTTTPATPTSPSIPTGPSLPTSPSLPTIPVIPFAQFEDRTWVLERYGKVNNLQAVIPGKEVSVRFDSSSNKLSGNSGCNGYNANYHRVLNKITISGMMGTLMSCPIPPGIMQQEHDFKDALSNAESCKIVGNRLEIDCSLNRLLVFIPK